MASTAQPTLPPAPPPPPMVDRRTCPAPTCVQTGNTRSREASHASLPNLGEVLVEVPVPITGCRQTSGRLSRKTNTEGSPIVSRIAQEQHRSKTVRLKVAMVPFVLRSNPPISWHNEEFDPRIRSGPCGLPQSNENLLTIDVTADACHTCPTNRLHGPNWSKTPHVRFCTLRARHAERRDCDLSRGSRSRSPDATAARHA